MSRDIQYALLDACSRGNLEYVKELLPLIKPRYFHNLLYDAMTNACIGNHYDLCVYLRNHTSDFDEQLSVADYNNLLWISGYHDQQNIMHWLIRQGATDHKYMTLDQTAIALNAGLEINNQHTLYLQITRQKTQTQLADQIQNIYDNTPNTFYDSNLSQIFKEYVSY